MNTNDQPMMARALIGGKKTEKLEARVSDEVKEAVRRRWTDLGYRSESEYLEEMVVIDIFGVEHLRSVLEQRFSRFSHSSDIGRTEPSHG